MRKLSLLILSIYFAITINAQTPIGLFGGGYGAGNIMLEITPAINLNGYADFNLKLMLEGLYNVSNQNMNKVQDYDGSSFYDKYSGNIATQISVELHDANNYNSPFITIENVSLQQDGTAVAYLPKSGLYYIRIKQTNHLETVSSIAIDLNLSRSYDFTTSADKAFGSNQKLLGSGVYGIFAGDVNGDGEVNVSDISGIQSKVQALSNGFLSEDVNGDGSVNVSDVSKCQTNVQSLVQSITP